MRIGEKGTHSAEDRNHRAMVQADHACRLSEEILSEEKDAIIEVGDKLL